MSNEERWKLAWDIAAARVAAEKASWPGCEDAVGGGGGRTSGNTSYERKGVGLNERYYNTPADISSLILDNARAATTDPELAEMQKTAFRRVLGTEPTDLLGYDKFQSVIGQSSTDYPGADALANVMQRDPYGGSFEADTEDAYRQRAANAMAQVASGPEAVRGGEARTGIAQGVLAEQLAQQRGYEVRAAQQAEMADVMKATQLANSVQQGLRQESLGAAGDLSKLQSGQDMMALEAGKASDQNRMYNLGILQLASQLAGTAVTKQTDDFYGHGDQSGSQWSAGMQCCFIFLTALNGQLPWFIEIARHEHVTPERRAGYKWMSRWLCPLMRRSRLAARIVNAVMIKPFLKYGSWLYGDESAKERWQGWWPLCAAWLRTWAFIGRIVR